MNEEEDSDDTTPSVFALGLPDWDIVPPSSSSKKKGTRMNAPHSYAEWSKILGFFKEKNMDSDILVAMKQGSIEWQAGVAERFQKIDRSGKCQDEYGL